LLQVGGFVDEDVADAYAAGDDGDRGVFAAQPVQALSTTGHDHVDVLVEAEKLRDEAAIGAIDVLNGRSGQTDFLEGRLDHANHGPVAAQGLTSTPQNRCVSGLQ